MASLLHQAILRWASPHVAFLAIQKSSEVLFLSALAVLDTFPSAPRAAVRLVV